VLEYQNSKILTRANHVRGVAGDFLNFIVEFIEDPVIHSTIIRGIEGGDVAPLLLLKPRISIGYVTDYESLAGKIFATGGHRRRTVPHEVIGGLQRIEGIDGGLVARLERVGCTRPHSCAQTVLAHRPHVTNHGELVRHVTASLAGSCEAQRLVTAQWQIIVLGVWEKASECHVVIPGGGALVGDGRLRRSRSEEAAMATAKAHGRPGQLLVGIPRHGHAIGASIRQTDLLWYGVLIARVPIVGTGGSHQGEDGEFAARE
jgi:hypothetical protein